MEYRKLGASGLKVSPICLGTMMFGARTDPAEVYDKGESERVTGKLIADDREKWVLATKVGNAMGKGPNETGLSRGWMMRAIDASLRRLNTDWIDIYYLHLDDASTPLEETLVAMGEIIGAGKARQLRVAPSPAPALV